MKNTLITILIIVTMIILFTIFTPNKTESVFSENDGVVLRKFDTKDLLLTTNNFSKYFDDIDVISINPNINKIYKDKFKNLETYKFDKLYSNNQNIIKFKNYYISNLSNSGINVDDFIIDGIKIDNVNLYISSNELNILKNKIINNV